MKRIIRKWFAIALTMILALSICTVAGATSGRYTITVNDASDASDSSVGNTYTLYKVADFDVSAGVYTNIKLTSAFSSLQNDFDSLMSDDEDSLDAASFAIKAGEVAESLNSNAGTLTVSTSNNSFSVTETGYYLIVDTAHSKSNPYLATKYILVAVDGVGTDMTTSETNENVYVKTTKARVEKKIVSEHDSELEDADTVAIGDTVTYQIDATIPTYASDATGITYKLTDVMSAGLSYASVVSVKISSDETTWKDATYNTEGSSDVGTAGATVVITLTSDSELRSNSYVRVELTATVNENASTGSTGNPNSVDLTYSNDYYGGGDGYTTPEDTVITYVGELEILKQDSDTKEALSGAVFTIYRKATSEEISDGTITKDTITISGTETSVIAVKTGVTTDTNGKAKITGLDAGTYYAVETKAPDGYSLDSDPKEIVLKVSGDAINDSTTGEAGTTKLIEEDSTATSGSAANTAISGKYTATWTVGTQSDNVVTITNDAGTTLPGTGGMGTALFTFGGLALVILAAIMFIVYTKKQRKQA
ncbi:MAG: SpaH/EbpB family LPXTG-anchored major pilin [Lachnospiraceae bacterium]|nr:SpaH/EbpB family LPXTG-anchored major pilin [Lachnospiraceae bacterium]